MSQGAGVCACGKVKVTMPINDRASLCYCTDCQKITSGTATLSLECRMREMHLTSPELVKVLSVKGEQGTWVHRWFCTECGSNIYVSMGNVPPDPDEEVFPYGGALALLFPSLFPPKTLPGPQTAVWTRNMESWETLPSSVTSIGIKQENVVNQVTREKAI